MENISSSHSWLSYVEGTEFTDTGWGPAIPLKNSGLYSDRAGTLIDSR